METYFYILIFKRAIWDHFLCIESIDKGAEV